MNELKEEIALKLKQLISRVVSTRQSNSTVLKTSSVISSRAKSNRQTLCISQAVILASIALFLLASLPSAYAITESIAIQGKLTDSDNKALTGTYAFIFEVFDSNAAPMNLLWS